MKPPICAYCGKDFRKNSESGALLTFQLTEAGKAHNEKLRRKGVVGHPAGKVWLCEKHKKTGAKYTHLTWQEAQSRMSSLGFLKGLIARFR